MKPPENLPKFGATWNLRDQLVYMLNSQDFRVFFYIQNSSYFFFFFNHCKLALKKGYLNFLNVTKLIIAIVRQ